MLVIVLRHSACGPEKHIACTKPRPQSVCQRPLASAPFIQSIYPTPRIHADLRFAACIATNHGVAAPPSGKMQRENKIKIRTKEKLKPPPFQEETTERRRLSDCLHFSLLNFHFYFSSLTSSAFPVIRKEIKTNLTPKQKQE